MGIKNKEKMTAAATKDAFPKTNCVVKIFSNDKQVFFVNEEIAKMSNHLAEVLNSGFDEGTTKKIELDIPSDILEICIKYMHYKVIYKNLPGRRPKFDLDPKAALRVLEAAIYL